MSSETNPGLAPHSKLDLVFWPVGHSALSLQEHLEIAKAGQFASLAIAPNRAKAMMQQGLTVLDLVDSKPGALTWAGRIPPASPKMRSADE